LSLHALQNLLEMKSENDKMLEKIIWHRISYNYITGLILFHISSLETNYMTKCAFGMCWYENVTEFHSYGHGYVTVSSLETDYMTNVLISMCWYGNVVRNMYLNITPYWTLVHIFGLRANSFGFIICELRANPFGFSGDLWWCLVANVL